MGGVLRHPALFKGGALGRERDQFCFARLGVSLASVHRVARNCNSTRSFAGTITWRSLHAPDTIQKTFSWRGSYMDGFERATRSFNMAKYPISDSRNPYLSQSWDLACALFGVGMGAQSVGHYLG